LLVRGGGSSDVNRTPSHTITMTNFDYVNASGIEGGRYLGGYLGRELLTDAVISIAKRNIHKGELRHWLPSF
jgi:hypothetical protein